MNFFGIMRKYLVPFSLICAMFPTFPTMSGAQGVFFPISYTQPTVFPGTKPLGRFGDQFANPTGTAVVDLNGDGFKDVVLALSVGLLNEASPPITPRFLISDGKGGLVDRTEELIVPPLPQMFLPRDIHVADFNGDGRPDPFFSNHGKETGGPSRVSLLIPASKTVCYCRNRTVATGIPPQRVCQRWWTFPMALQLPISMATVISTSG
jgi:FG-GAP-like repeat